MPGDDVLVGQWLKGRVDAARVLDFAHYEVHEGSVWRLDNPPVEIADNAVLSFALLIGDKEVHMGFMGGSGGDGLGYLFEDPTLSATGTSMVPIPMNRANQKVSTVQAWANATCSASGTYILSAYLAGGEKKQATGGEGRTQLEVILKPNTWYFVFMVNVAGDTKWAQMIAEWYEHNVNLPR